MEYDIVIIDTGCNKEQYEYIDCINLTQQSDFDSIGHGSAIASIIHYNAPDAKILMLKVTDNYVQQTVENLIFALNYILKKNIVCKIVNISMGSVYIKYHFELNKIIDAFKERGILIVSAYDNDGFISYPAAIPYVIGVDCDYDCRSVTDYIITENCDVNVLACSSFIRAVDHNNTKTLVKGTSFACAIISAIIFNVIKSHLLNKANLKPQVVLDIMKQKAKFIVSRQQNNNTNNSFIKTIKSAVVFPYNKEIHAIAHFEELLSFNVCDYFDHRINGNISRRISHISPHIKNDKIIRNIDGLDWTSNFDTIICGHCNVLSKILKIDIVADLIQKCITFKKNMYYFGDLSPYAEMIKGHEGRFYYPSVTTEDVPNSGEKLSVISMPVVGVFGTSSKQGKYTLQLLLRKELQELGYKVGSLGSEPSGYLFGFNYVFPYGYEGTSAISDFDTVLTLNNQLCEMEKKEYDIALAGTQSNTVPYDAHYRSNMCFSTYDFLVGILPDVVVLCINIDDPFDYISKTIQFIYAVSNARVVALAIFPNGISRKNTDFNIKEFKKKVYENYNIPLFEINSRSAKELALYLIDYLS